MTPREALGFKLAAGIAQLGLQVDVAAQQRLLDYIELLDKWNKVHNLTAVREAEEIVTLHLLDSLTVLPYVSGAKSMMDLGSGAGLPGIPVAITRAETKVTLLDSNQKKVAFMRQAKAELDLTNITVVGERAEDFRPEPGFDCVVSRAFGDLADFVQVGLHLVARGGTLLAMKGVYPYEELAKLPASVMLREVVPVALPFSKAKRHLVLMKAA